MEIINFTMLWKERERERVDYYFIGAEIITQIS